MVVLDMSIVNVALATIKSDLGFSEAGLQWVITAYAIIFGGFLLLGGRLADILGRRRVFIAGHRRLHARLRARGLAWSASSLIAFRGLQGLGGALFAPAGLSILMTTFREGRERNLALGIWGAASGSGAAVGVLLGGVLTSYLSWPWIFYLNVPVGLALVVLAPRRLAESRADDAGAALRRRRRDDDHGVADAARLRADPRDAERLGQPLDDRAARRVSALLARRVRRRRAAG